MGVSYSSKIVVGVRLSSILEHVDSFKTKYNPDTGEPYQVPIKRYKLLGKEMDSLPSSEEDEELNGLQLHSIGYISDTLENGRIDQAILGIKAGEADFYNNFREVSESALTQAKAKVSDLLAEHHPDVEPQFYIIQHSSY